MRRSSTNRYRSNTLEMRLRTIDGPQWSIAVVKAKQDKRCRGGHGGSRVVHYATKTCDRTVVSLVALQTSMRLNLASMILVRHVQNKDFAQRTLARHGVMIGLMPPSWPTASGPPFCRNRGIGVWGGGSGSRASPDLKRGISE